MEIMKNLGVIVLLIGAILLIYLGIVGTGHSNVLLGIGLALVVVGFIGHILLNKYLHRGA